MPAELAKSIKAALRERALSRLDELALDAYGLTDLPTFDFVDPRK